MVMCSFDMQFIFVCAGWEDNTHDTCFFLEAIGNPNIRLLKPLKGNIIKKKSMLFYEETLMFL
jgi:hypothetical protein